MHLVCFTIEIYYDARPYERRKSINILHVLRHTQVGSHNCA